MFDSGGHTIMYSTGEATAMRAAVQRKGPRDARPLRDENPELEEALNPRRVEGERVETLKLVNWPCDLH